MCPFQPIQAIGLVFLVLFYLVTEALRWYLVGRPLALTLEARRAQAREDARRLGFAAGDPGLALIAEKVGGRFRGLWTGASELVGWMNVHRAEEMFVRGMGRPEVDARLVHERGNLSLLGAAASATWAPILERDLDPTTAGSVTDDQAKADLAGMMNARHLRSDESFRSYIDLVRKAMLLGVTGVLLIGGLMIILPSAIPVLLAGAVGGFLSRLRRVYTNAHTATDYGASWVPLLLAPLVGALTGWAGITLVYLAVQLGVLDANLGTLFPAQACAAFESEPSAALLGLALLFGFAEQLFEGFSRSLSDRLATSKAAEAADTSESPTA